MDYLQPTNGLLLEKNEMICISKDRLGYAAGNQQPPSLRGLNQQRFISGSQYLPITCSRGSFTAFIVVTQEPRLMVYPPSLTLLTTVQGQRRTLVAL